MPVIVLESENAGQTLAIGAALGRILRGGDVLALSGALGAGKTQLTKGVAAGLGVADDEPVVSPTFVLMREYAGRLRLYHLDTYRLGGADELWALGIDELFAEQTGVVVIEWADRVAEILPERAWRIELSHVDADRRRIEIHVSDAARLEALCAALEGGGDRI